MRKNILPPGSYWKDPNEVRIPSWIESMKSDENFDAVMLSVPLSNINTQPNRAWAAADAIRKCFSEFTTYSSDFDIDISHLNVSDFGTVNLTASNTQQNLENITNEILWIMQENPDSIPIIIGGDHSTTVPSGKAFSQANPDQSIGMIYFDAHHDVRILATDIPLAGSQVRVLLKECNNLSGSNVVQIGLHGYMNSIYYKHWAEQQGIHIYPARNIRLRGIASIIDEVVEKILKNVDLIYISVDIDVLSQIYAIGASGRISPDGMELVDLLEAVYTLGQNHKVKFFDIVEYDPSQDIRDLTARTCCSIILSFLAGLMKRKSN